MIEILQKGYITLFINAILFFIKIEITELANSTCIIFIVYHEVNYYVSFVIYTYSVVVLDVSVYANHNSTSLSTQRWMPISG